MKYEDIKHLFDDDEDDKYDWLLIILVLISFTTKDINIYLGDGKNV